MSVTFALTGDKDLDGNFLAFRTSVQKRLLRSPLRAGAKIVAELAKRLAPKRTGALRRGITVRARKSKIKTKIIMQAMINPNFLTKTKAKFFYPAAMEYGVKRKGGERRPAPRKYMRGAYEESYTVAAATVKRLTEDAIKAELAKLAAKQQAKSTARG